MHPEITKLLQECKKNIKSKESGGKGSEERDTDHTEISEISESSEIAKTAKKDAQALSQPPIELPEDALFTLANNGFLRGFNTADSYQKAYSLVNFSSQAAYIDRSGAGVLNALFRWYHGANYILFAQDFTEHEYCIFFENMFRLSLKNGFNPLCCDLDFDKTANQLKYMSLFKILSARYTDVRYALGPDYVMIADKLKEVDNVFSACFIHLIDYGAGLLEYEARGVDHIRESLLNAVGTRAIDAGDDIGTKAGDEIDRALKRFAFYFGSTIVVKGVRLKDNKRVWIYSLKVLEEILSGKMQDIVLPNLNQIAANVFQTEERYLSDGVRALFDKYKKELNVYQKPSVRDLQYYQDFKQAAMTLRVAPAEEISKDKVNVSENIYYDFVENEDELEYYLVNHDIRKYQPWLYRNIVEVLQMFAEKNAEASFLELLSKHQAFLGEEHFLSFIKNLDEKFFKLAGQLLLFYCIGERNFEMIKYLMDERCIPLDGKIGVRRNSVLIELAIASVESRAAETREILEFLLERAGTTANLLVSYLNEQQDTALHFFSRETGHEACIEILLKAGASPCIINKAGETPISNVLRYYNKCENAMTLLFRFGGGLLTREYRIFCSSMKCDIEGGLKKLDELEMEPLNRDDEQNFVPVPQGFRIKSFDIPYYESDFILAESGEVPQKNQFRYFNNLKLISKSLYGNKQVDEEQEKQKEEDTVLLENLGLIRGHVLNADEFLIVPEVRKLFEEESRNCVKLGEILIQFLNCDIEVHDIITSYLCNGLAVSKSRDFWTKKDKRTKEEQSSSSLISELNKAFSLPQLTRAKFMHELWKVLRWEKENKRIMFGEYDSEYNQVIMSNDIHSSNVSRLQALIDNGLLVKIIVCTAGGNPYSSCVIHKKINFLKVLVDAGLKMGVLGKYMHINGGLCYALERRDMISAEILIDAGACLTASEVGVRHHLEKNTGRFSESVEFLKKLTEIITKKKNFPALLDPDGMLEKEFNAILQKSEQDPEIRAKFRNLAEERLVAYNFFNPDAVIFRLIRENKSKCLDILIKANADVNAENSPKLKLPFTYAIEVGDLACIEVLIEQGAQLNESSPFAKTAGERAVERSQKPGCEYFMRDLLEVLKKKGKSETVLWLRLSQTHRKHRKKEEAEMPGALLPLFTAGQDQEQEWSFFTPERSDRRASNSNSSWWFLNRKLT